MLKTQLQLPVFAAPEADPQGRPPDRAARHRYRWAQLLQSVFEINALRCPRFGSAMKIVSFIVRLYPILYQNVSENRCSSGPLILA